MTEIASRARAFGTAASSLVCASVGLAQTVLTPIALTGDDAPGTGGGRFERFEAPYLTSSGEAIFEAWLETGPGAVSAANNHGIWATIDGRPSLVVRIGSTATGAGGATFAELIEWQANAAGDVAFLARLQHGSNGVDESNDLGIWVRTDDGTALSVRSGSVAADTNGATFAGMEPGLAFGASGDLAFRGVLQAGIAGVGAANDLGIWSVSQDSMQLIARTGGDAGFIGFDPPQISASGDVAFRANGINAWATSGGHLVPVAIAGASAPGTNGAIFSSTGWPVLNSHDQVAFAASLLRDTGGVTFRNAKGIWVMRDGSVGLLARGEDEAPGTGGARFIDFSSVAMNDAGDVVFRASLLTGEAGVTPENNLGMWSTANSDFRLIAREGAEAPGCGGARFDLLSHPRLVNMRGDIALSGSLKSPAGGSDGWGSWIYSHARDRSTLLARTGERLNVSDDPGVLDLRTIGSIPFLSTGEIEPQTDSWQIVVSLRFTDDTRGLFTASVPTGPCRCDIDQMGEVDIFDLLAYLALWFAREPSAEFDGNTGIDAFDLLAYVDCWFPASAGACP